MERLEVFADVTCPFTHVGLRRLIAERAVRGVAEPVLHVRAWPLELVNDEPTPVHVIAPEVNQLRANVVPDLFQGFRPDVLPPSTIPWLAEAAAAYGRAPDDGERYSLDVRDAIFERGVLPEPGPYTDDDVAAVHADLAEGRERGVQGSPHFFTDHGDFFCPSLDVRKESGEVHVSFDEAGLARFLEAVFG